MSGADLAATLRGLDGASYARYRSLRGSWSVAGTTVEVLRVQADPFAPPSRLRVTVPDAALPGELCDTPDRRRALAAVLLRVLRGRLSGSPLHVDAGGPEVLERTAGRVDADGRVVVELSCPLPGPKRRILGREAATLLTATLPDAVAALRWAALDQEAARAFVAAVEDAVALRAQLADRGLVAFVADGAVLPRRTGVDARPLPDAVASHAPDALAVTLEAPHAGALRGLGVPEGVTVVVGGGYHGKSTLLRAIEAGVYDHEPGDGRERVVTRADAVKVRAEDGRAVTRVDVSAFVTELPAPPGAPPRRTDDFSTADASGSTSQAAAIVEAVEAGAGVLLVDEDTSATNLLVRDGRMQRLVTREPLVPFVERVRPLHREHGVSTVLVTGGSGDYLDVADTVVMMDAWVAHEVTARAREVAAAGAVRTVEHRGFPTVAPRVVDPASLDPTGARGRTRVTARGTDRLTLGEDDVDLGALEQLVDRAQAQGVGRALALLGAGPLDGGITLAEGLDLLDAELADRGVAALLDDAGGHAHGEDLALPRRHEVAAALNRLRSLRVLRVGD